jgi:hypothetical protein
MAIKVVRAVEKKTTRTITLLGSDIVVLLNNSRVCFDIPPTAEIRVAIPGGGDWSNTDLEISNIEIHISWKEVEKESFPSRS